MFSRRNDAAPFDRSSRDTRARQRQTILPWYLIAVGVAVAASTSAAQKRAVALLSDVEIDRTDPLPDAAPNWLKRSKTARYWWTVVTRVIIRTGRDNLTLVSAGIAFYAMFAIFPALGALVSIYGMFGDAHFVQTQVQQLAQLLPHETATIFTDALSMLTAKPNASLNSGLVISLALAIWGARAGTSSLMAGLNMALERPEGRGIITLNLIAIALTFGAILFAIVALTSVAIIPIVLNTLPIDPLVRSWLAYTRWPVLILFILVSLDIIYRFAPSHAQPRWTFLSVGTLFAMIFWILGSLAFSTLVTRFGTYDATYGSLGAVIVLLLWFWLSALIVLLGAAVDAVRADMRR